ncbi:MAG TPA: tetratricopeptide repeat protein [Kofleriaceae bacterium]
MSVANARGSLANLLAFGLVVALVGMVAGCPSPEADIEKSNKRLDIAKDALGHNNLDMAEAEASKAIAFNKANDEAWNIRGLVSIVRAFGVQRTLEIDGCLTGVDAESTHQDLDAFLKKADADFQGAIKANPEYGEAYSNRGLVANLLEDYASAATLYSKALEFPFHLGDTAVTRAGLGWAYFNQEKFVDAAKELRTVLQFKPKMCIGNFRLGRVYFARQEWDKAAESFQTASEDASCASQEASYYLMKTRMQQGLMTEARAARDACLKLSPKSCIANKCLAEGAALGAP